MRSHWNLVWKIESVALVRALPIVCGTTKHGQASGSNLAANIAGTWTGGVYDNATVYEGTSCPRCDAILQPLS